MEEPRMHLTPEGETANGKARTTLELHKITLNNVNDLKKVNLSIFPVAYPEKFYKDIIQFEDLSRLAYFNGHVVGGVCCRISVAKENQLERRSLYIMTLGCFAAYRQMGIGTKLLEYVMSYAEREGSFESIGLHVQVGNEVARYFYQKFGFEVKSTIENYYRRLEPNSAYFLEKKLC